MKRNGSSEKSKSSTRRRCQIIYDLSGLSGLGWICEATPNLARWIESAGKVRGHPARVPRQELSRPCDLAPPRRLRKELHKLNGFGPSHSEERTSYEGNRDLLSCMLIGSSAALAQGNASGRGSTTGDPAASTANPSAEPSGTTGSSRSNPSGSGTSTSGKDDNGDQGRDKMPDSNMNVRPLDQQAPKPK
jgi:hypothetical protein